MNNRIRELAQQAGYSPLEPRAFADDLQEVFLQKFAELIVEECSDIVASRPYIDDGNWPHPSTMIKNQFGIEEPKEFAWVCEKCGANRAKEPCKLAVEGKAVYGNCPIIGVTK